jgi:hypothetical protein
MDGQHGAGEQCITEFVISRFKGELVLLDSKGQDDSAMSSFEPMDSPSSLKAPSSPTPFDDLEDEIPF